MSQVLLARWFQLFIQLNSLSLLYQLNVFPKPFQLSRPLCLHVVYNKLHSWWKVQEDVSALTCCWTNLPSRNIFQFFNLFIVYFSFFVGAPVNVTDQYGLSPLHFILCFSFFVGAPVNVADVFGRSPLHYAAVKGHCKLAEVLLQKGEFIFALLILYLLYNADFSKL